MTYVTKQIRLVSNKFNCRRSGPEDELEVRLSVKGMKQKQPTVVATVSVPWLDGSSNQLSDVGCVKDAVLEGDKIYFPLVASPEYRDVIHGDCALGILVS